MGGKRATYHIELCTFCIGGAGTSLFDANIEAIKGPLVGISDRSGSDWEGANDGGDAWEFI